MKAASSITLGMKTRLPMSWRSKVAKPIQYSSGTLVWKEPSALVVISNVLDGFDRVDGRLKVCVKLV